MYFRTPTNAMMTVSVTRKGRDVAIGRPRRLFDATRFDTPYAVGPDDRLLMMPALPTESAATEIRLVVNFLAELRTRLR